MSKKRLPENSPAVKNKSRTRRSIPPGVAITLADILKLSERSQGPKKNPAVKIKRAFQTYIERCPGLTSTTKRVGCFLVDWYRLRDGYARPPISRIMEELDIGHGSACRAIKTFHDSELIFVKSGGPTRRQGFGTIASRYVPNFWLVINRDTGEIIRNAKYRFAPLKSIAGAGAYSQSGDRGAYSQSGDRVKPLKRIRGAGDYSQSGTRYLSTKAGANASPCASTDATATASAAPPKKQSGINTDNYETREFFIKLGELVPELEIESITEFLDRGESPAAILLDRYCYEDIFNGGKPVSNMFLNSRPDGITDFVCIELIAKEGTYRERETGFNTAPDSIDEDSIVFVQYRIPPTVREQAEKDFETAEKARYG